MELALIQVLVKSLVICVFTAFLQLDVVAPVVLCQLNKIFMVESVQACLFLMDTRGASCQFVCVPQSLSLSLFPPLSYLLSVGGKEGGGV